MKLQYCDSPEDIEWLKSTHLKNASFVLEFGAFVLHGNEDAPERVDLYPTASPNWNEQPISVVFTV